MNHPKKQPVWMLHLTQLPCVICGATVRPARGRRFVWAETCSKQCGALLRGKRYSEAMKAKPELPRFELKFRKTDGCWEWLAMKAQGYGRFRFHGVLVRAHRMSYLLYVGEIPSGQVVRHKCDNRGCVNPNHLELGTHADNIRDSFERGMLPLGEKHHLAKLTATQVLQIRELARIGDISQRGLARQFGVGKNAIASILRGASWKHLQSPLPTTKESSDVDRLSL